MAAGRDIYLPLRALPEFFFIISDEGLEATIVRVLQDAPVQLHIVEKGAAYHCRI